jgi:hypothetical protein
VGSELNEGGGASKAEVEILNLGTDWSAGDNQIVFAEGVEGKRQFIKHGTNASPLTTSGPTVKVVRTEAITAATIEGVGGAGTDGADQVAALMGLSVGKPTNQIQSVGVYGGALNSSSESTGNPDATGGYFIGHITGGTAVKATAIGATIIGRRAVATADMSGAEISANNQTETAGAYSTSGASSTRVLWLYANGKAAGGCIVNIGNPNSVKAQVGIGIPNQNGGAITEARRGRATALQDHRPTHRSPLQRARRDSGRGGHGGGGDLPLQLLEGRSDRQAGGRAETDR